MLYRVCRSLGLSVALLLVCLSAWAAEFSADLMMTSGGKQSRGKVYLKGTRMRCELAHGDRRIVFLTQSGRSSVTIIIPEKRIYWAQPDPTAADIFDDKRILKQATKNVVGQETIAGYKCRKAVYTYRDKTKGVVTRWVSTRLKVPLKWEETQGDARTVTEFRGILERKLQDSMFSPPAGFKKLTEKQVQEMMKRGAEKAKAQKAPTKQ